MKKMFLSDVKAGINNKGRFGVLPFLSLKLIDKHSIATEQNPSWTNEIFLQKYVGHIIKNYKANMVQQRT